MATNGRSVWDRFEADWDAKDAQRQEFLSAQQQRDLAYQRELQDRQSKPQQWIEQLELPIF